MNYVLPILNRIWFGLVSNSPPPFAQDFAMLHPWLGTPNAKPTFLDKKPGILRIPKYPMAPFQP